jgi:hypothetical protein
MASEKHPQLLTTKERASALEGLLREYEEGTGLKRDDELRARARTTLARMLVFGCRGADLRRTTELYVELLKRAHGG